MKIRKFLDSNIYIPIVFIISFCFWYLAYSHRLDENAIEFMSKVENVFLLSYSIIVSLLLIFFKNTFYIIPWIIFTPFIFGRPFDILTTPIFIYIALGIIVVALLLNIIIYKPKLIIGKFFWGFLVLCIAFVLGGINVPSDNYYLQLFVTIFSVVAFLLAYLLVASSSKVNFKNVARLMTYLGIFLFLQLLIYYLSTADIIIALQNKNSNVGWGISNNIALLLLLTMPFTLYLAINNKNIKSIIYLLVFFIQVIAIIFTYSRGSILALAFGLLFLIPLSIWKAKDKLTISITYLVIAILSALSLYIFKQKMPEEFQNILNIILRMDFDNFNGRTPIYEDCINALKENPIFGKGLLSSFKDVGTGQLQYEWGHSTILQTIRTMGIVGCLAMVFHLIQKYYVLIKKINIWKFTVLASFALSGIYGLFDVSYYFVNYMIPLVFIMAMIEYEYNKSGDDYEVL